MPSLLDLPFGELERTLVAAALHPSHARPLWRALYRELATSLDVTDRPDFLPPLRRWLSENPAHTLDVPAEADAIPSTDGLTRKFLLRLADEQTVETVLMAYPGRFTACLSTQAGCAMGCVFCATGQMGFARHLRPGEIVAQVLHVQRALRVGGAGGLRNLVLMGMGEPLHNYNNVMTALDIITDDRGLNLGPARVSISTVGVVPGILRLAQEGRPYNLAVSLHGASEAERAALVPASKRWPLAELIAACRTYGAKTGRRIFFRMDADCGGQRFAAGRRASGGAARGTGRAREPHPAQPDHGFLRSGDRARGGRRFSTRGAGRGVSVHDPAAARHRRRRRVRPVARGQGEKAAAGHRLAQRSLAEPERRFSRRSCGPGRITSGAT